MFSRNQSLMNKKVTVLLFLILLNFSGRFSTAQAQGSAFTYQGRLNSGASPAQGIYDLRFTLFDAASAGTAQGAAVTTNGIPVSNGLFTVTLDFGNQFPGAARWLEIGARTNGASSFTTLSSRQPLTPTPYAITAGNLSGVLSPASLAGAYTNQVAISNATDIFAGNGSGLTGVNAAALNGLGANGFWQTAGNAGTSPSTNYVGTADNQALELRVNGKRALRAEPNTNGAPNLIGGSPINYVSNTIIGATIAGGGALNYSGTPYSNSVAGNFGSVGGGFQNGIRADFATISGGFMNTAAGIGSFIGGGAQNVASGGGGVVGGGQNNTNIAAAGTIAGGTYNTANAAGGFIGGGGFDGFSWAGNLASGAASAIAGGMANLATNKYSSVAGGTNNISGGFASFAGGGFRNTANGDYSTIGGGEGNSVLGFQAAVAGGSANYAGGDNSFVGGGYFNFANNYGNTIGGGYENNASGYYSTIGGGYNNHTAGGFLSAATVSGGYANQANNDAATVAGGYNNIASGLGAVIGGGGYDGGTIAGNHASGNASLVAGGLGNQATNSYAVVGGGLDNTAGQVATVGGGSHNVASGTGAFVGGGGDDGTGYFGNTASGGGSAIGGGVGNKATAYDSTVAGGLQNIASGTYAAVPGGIGNTASGYASFAAGYSATAAHQGAFVWADTSTSVGSYSSDRNYQFKARATGGVVFDVSGSSGLNPAALRVNSTSANGVGIFVAQTSSDATAVFTAGGSGDIIKGFNGGNNGVPVFEVINSGIVYATSFNSTSDRNAKTNFTGVSSLEVLEKVMSLPITTWNFKSDSPEQQHLGPMAQDFHAAFALNGSDDKHISLVDEGGVALAAIQGLNQKLDQKNSEIQELRRKNETLEQRLEILEHLVKQRR
jgi:hypothetical protein